MQRRLRRYILTLFNLIVFLPFRSVFLCVLVTSLSSDTDRQYVMKLSPLPQLPAAKLKNKKRKKTPAERNADALYAEHLLYKNHLRDQPGIPYVPLGAYGEDKVST